MPNTNNQYPREFGFIKEEIFNLSNELNCSLIYRPFSEDAFPTSLEASIKELTIITYTSPGALATILELIKNRYPLIQNVTLVIGLAYSKKDLQESPNGDQLSKLSLLKRSFEDGVNNVLTELEKNLWANTDINITLHNHCHIKYFQAGDTCITGSQNFAGTIVKSKKTSAFCKNELMVEVYESEAKLSAISSELLQYLHAHDDEYVQLDKATLLSDDFNVTEVFEMLKEKRLAQAYERDKYGEVFRDIDNDYFFEVMHEIEIQDELEQAEKRHIPPSQFDVYSNLQTLLESDELSVESLLSAVDKIEEVFELSELSELINESKDSITEAIENVIQLPFTEDLNELLIDNDDIEPIELDLAKTQLLVRRTLANNIEVLVGEYMEDFYIEILQHCCDVLKCHSFNDPSDFIQSNKSEIVDELIQESPDTLPVNISEYYSEPDLLVPIANDYVDCMDVADIQEFAPNHFASQLDSVREGILEFEGSPD